MSEPLAYLYPPDETGRTSLRYPYERMTDRRHLEIPLCACASMPQAQPEPVADVLSNGNTFKLRQYLPPGTVLYASPPPAQPTQADTLCERLQQQCSDWGTYWRAPDAHGVNLTLEQAHELLRTALGVEVEIAAQPTRERLTDEQIDALHALKMFLIGAAAGPYARNTDALNIINAGSRAIERLVLGEGES